MEHTKWCSTVSLLLALLLPLRAPAHAEAGPGAPTADVPADEPGLRWIRPRWSGEARWFVPAGVVTPVTAHEATQRTPTPILGYAFLTHLETEARCTATPVQYVGATTTHGAPVTLSVGEQSVGERRALPATESLDLGMEIICDRDTYVAVRVGTPSPDLFVRSSGRVAVATP